MSNRATSVDLLTLDLPTLQTLIDRNLLQAGSLLGHSIPPDFANDTWLWELRADQLKNDPPSNGWLVHAVVGQPANAIVGHAGFHGPPDERGMVEIGYSIVPEHRRVGYARVTLLALIAYARDHGAQVVRASIRPDNTASLATIAGHGFTQVGEQWDDIDGLELIFERPLT